MTKAYWTEYYAVTNSIYSDSHGIGNKQNGIKKIKHLLCKRFKLK